MTARPRLTLPTRLAVTVSLAACTSSPPPGDASPARPDVADDARADAPGDAFTDAPGDAFTDVFADVRADAPGDVPGDARMCTRNPFDPENPGFAVRCLARRGATQPCPEASVCVAEDCPAHCEGCVSPLFCIPDPERDAGVACVVSTACSEDACNPGCRAVG
ncbi:MAG: hypothetical protein U0325_05805 [Polyangiales bacterium]